MAVLTAAQVQQEVARLAGKGLVTAGYFLKARIQENLSVAAPRTRVTSGPRSRNPGTIYYRATTAATPGAFPRKLSGRGRASIALEHDPKESIVRVGTNVRYMGRHERGTHPFLLPTLARHQQAIGSIIGSNTSG